MIWRRRWWGCSNLERVYCTVQRQTAGLTDWMTERLTTTIRLNFERNSEHKFSSLVVEGGTVLYRMKRKKEEVAMDKKG